jgi:hypothetical protein
MKVKIIKCSNDSYWYQKYIDKTYNVIDGFNSYIVEDENSIYNHSYIDKEDCEIIEDNLVIKQLQQKINQLEKRIQALEGRPQYIPYPVYPPPGGTNPYPWYPIVYCTPEQAREEALKVHEMIMKYI